MARLQQRKQAAVTTGSAGTSRLSRANGFNGVLRALPGDRLSCLHFTTTRLWRVAQTSASRGQDHTTSPSAMAMLVAHSRHVHRSPPPRIVTTRTSLFDEAGYQEIITISEKTQLSFSIWRTAGLTCTSISRSLQARWARHPSCLRRTAGVPSYHRGCAPDLSNKKGQPNVAEPPTSCSHR